MSSKYTIEVDEKGVPHYVGDSRHYGPYRYPVSMVLGRVGDAYAYRSKGRTIHDDYPDLTPEEIMIKMDWSPVGVMHDAGHVSNPLPEFKEHDENDKIMEKGH